MKNRNAAQKPRVRKSAQPADESAAEKKKVENVDAPAGRDSRQALLKMMKMSVEKFHSIENHECPSMAELLRQGLAGNLWAGKRITDIVEGPACGFHDGEQ
jgi:hypothetical protein